MILVLDRGWWRGLVVPVMFTSSDPFTWTWADIIDRNTGLLKPIIDALFTLLGGAARFSPGVHRRILRVLLPAESAVRRLIVIAALDVVAKPLGVRPKPGGPIITSKAGTSRCCFALFDPRKRFVLFQQMRKRKVVRVAPRFYLVGSDPPGTAPWFAQPVPVAPAVPALPPPDDGLVDGARVSRRLHALRSALADIPRQAQRLARWRLRRLSKPHLRKMDCMRYGRAPGYRKQKTREIDDILADCHYFACEALKPDTS
jgi:hypothetical protein